MQIGSFHSTAAPEDNAITGDIRTATPPLEDAPLKARESRESDQETEDVTAKKQQQPWIVRPHAKKTSVMHPPAVSLPAAVPPPVMMAPAMAMPALHLPPTSMAFPLAVPPPAAARYMRQRSMSVGGDPWGVQGQMGYGVFIARLPFGVQPADVEEAFSAFGPILGGRDGIQVHPSLSVTV